MTVQEVVNIALIDGYESMSAKYSRSSLMGMYYVLTGREFGRKSASKYEIAFAVYNYINKMNRAAAFNGDKVYEVHTPEVDGLLACLRRNSESVVLQYFPEFMLATAYKQSFRNGNATNKREMLTEIKRLYRI